MKKMLLLMQIVILVSCKNTTDDYGEKGEFIHYVQQQVLTGHDLTVNPSDFREGCFTVEYDGHIYGHPKNCKKCVAEKNKMDSIENAAYSTIDTSKIAPIHPDHLKYIEAGYGHVYIRTSDGYMVHDPKCPNPFHKIKR